MSDNANPLKTYHQRQITDQATPVRAYGPDGGTPEFKLSGSNGEQGPQGPIASIPAADSVPENSTYFALDEGKLYWTNGSAWAEVGA